MGRLVDAREWGAGMGYHGGCVPEQDDQFACGGCVVIWALQRDHEYVCPIFLDDGFHAHEWYGHIYRTLGAGDDGNAGAFGGRGASGRGVCGAASGDGRCSIFDIEVDV